MDERRALEPQKPTVDRDVTADRLPPAEKSNPPGCGEIGRRTVGMGCGHMWSYRESRLLDRRSTSCSHGPFSAMRRHFSPSKYNGTTSSHSPSRARLAASCAAVQLIQCGLLIGGGQWRSQALSSGRVSCLKARITRAALCDDRPRTNSKAAAGAAERKEAVSSGAIRVPQSVIRSALSTECGRRAP